MNDRMPRSFLQYCGTSKSRCGYCKNARGMRINTGGGEGDDVDDSSIQDGALTTRIDVDDYMSLLDRGWRRSGTYLYKPKNDETCCPQYTIRLDVSKFILSRSQKRVLRQMNEFLESDKKPRCGVKEECDTTKLAKQEKKLSEKDEKPIKAKDSDRPVLKKKEIRMKKFEEKCRAKNLDIEEIKKKRAEKEEARRRTIESYDMGNPKEWKHKLEINIVGLKDPEFKNRFMESFELFKKYQEAIHGDTDNTISGFKQFLCSSPLNNPERISYELGPYHMQFLLDGKLLAVSVIDILPRCLSAKYMFYNPDYAFLSMGTYTALKEIEFNRKLFAENTEMRYYYMGYYIHSCPKMRYKAKFRPSDLLCDNSFLWVDFETCKSYLDQSEAQNGHAIFAPTAPKARPADISKIYVIHGTEVWKLQHLFRENVELQFDVDFVYDIQMVKSFDNPKRLSALLILEFIGTLQICVPMFDVGTILDNYGLFGVFIEITVIELANCYFQRDAVAHPCPLVTNCYRKSKAIRRGIYVFLTQLAAAYLSYFIARCFWRLGIHPIHEELLNQSTCTSDLTVAITTGCIIEGAATFVARAFEKFVDQKYEGDTIICSIANCAFSGLLCAIGINYTGMYANPIVAWACTFNCLGVSHVGHLLVYWLSPLIAWYFGELVYGSEDVLDDDEDVVETKKDE
ncbi:unnamed protein product [Caenorhabditis bovis]|uniref:arginyltransferase n=1 Tax=Caenorhabditis bovis TaxID=2654633 RepID=A0A8S1FC78_9PELO|nr:unnamed protein product [Caenorhabditis bovis]